ncbi:SAC3/GANP/Nin1/mts3/eIF-3 p25 family-domain-containing protein [Vararia minispora EC-137]|uniref:SAC3/GANP/Nin1/mts3/eIF-3 p25 family-domain-containing protein n=1 Tax=Vararia minispora EC-137 TaxID=1314806 RepID=A0ACB8QPI3_9AGAM|nr:SAC3/GANP/Nin1/mts3/eIF-3 p25 family-domain-containing protein [Vararia minispora EC-137]
MSTLLSRLHSDVTRTFSSSNLQKCGEHLSKAKLALIESDLIFPSVHKKVEELVAARDILEIGAFWSIRTKDVPSFDRYFSQLQTFYNDLSSVLPPSQREYPIRGLNLIRLLTQNRIADFHTTLESLPLPAEKLVTNPYIQHPVNLELWLMEGSYSKVWNAREEAPAEEYKFFVDSLMGTIRQIASCEEAAYHVLPLKDAATLLFFRTQSEVLNFAQERNWQIDIAAGQIVFPHKSEEDMEIPREKLIANDLVYARELEQIV